MRGLGRALTALGVVVGVGLGVAMLAPVHLVGVTWLIAAGLAKLTFAASLGLIGAGAALQRMALRADERAKLAPMPRAEA